MDCIVNMAFTSNYNQVTQLVTKARKNLEDELPQTLKISKKEQIRITAKAGQVCKCVGSVLFVNKYNFLHARIFVILYINPVKVAAWTFAVEDDLDIIFSAEFFSR